MTDGQWLLAALAALYVIEAVRWLPARAWMITGTDGRWSLSRPWQQLQAQGWALALLPLLPPVQAHAVLLPWLLLPRKDGLLVVDSDDATPVLLPWKNLAVERIGASLHFSARTRLRLPDEASARDSHALVQHWQALPENARLSAFAKHVRPALNPQALRGHLEDLSRRTRAMRLLSALIFVWCFGIMVTTYRWCGEGWEILSASAMLLIMMWLQAVLYWRCTRHSTWRGGHRFLHALGIAFLPHMAMHALTVLCKGTPCTAHPLAVRGLVGEAAWVRLLRLTARRLDASGAVPERAVFDDFLAQQGLSHADLEQVPERQPGSVSYCPRCLAQFRVEAGICSDCAGVELKRWS